MKCESTMGCKLHEADAKMQKGNSGENDSVSDIQSNTSRNSDVTSADLNSVQNTQNLPAANRVLHTPSAQQGHGLPHSSTDPNFRGARPHSAHHHRQIGQILRILGDGYCYSCGIALRQMGDQLSGEYEVRRALSTGDLPNSVKNS